MKLLNLLMKVERKKMIDLKGNPFYLSDRDIKWVEDTKSSMDLDERIGQLFIAHGVSGNKEYLKNSLDNRKYGGFMFRPNKSEVIHETHAFLQRHSRIPLLLAANLEYGGTGIAFDGTDFGQQMQIAATNNPELAYKLGKVSCSEGALLGCNLAFAPVVDIDYEFRNPITNVRTYGSNPSRVLEMSKEYLKAAKESGVGVSIKHFPGDGVDERDQHLVVSVNSLTCEEWDESYGRIYKELIKDGALTVMVGSISMPAYQKKINPKFPKKNIPATVSPELLKGLLREKLQFNGLIISDSTVMVGLSALMPREELVPKVIESGCDMFLFTRDEDEDFRFMKNGYLDGKLSEKRLDEAVTRILATKAALKLHDRKTENDLVPKKENIIYLKNPEHVEWAKDCADKAITLVKDTQNILPISKTKYKKVLLQVVGEGHKNEYIQSELKSLLEKEGLNVTVYEKEDFSKGLYLDSALTFREKYDLVIYFANEENTSSKTVTRLKWHTVYGLGNNTPWFAGETPVIFISFANPYHLIDVPMIKTYINCYSNNEYVMESVIEKIFGMSEFLGINPIDPFCGREDTKY